MSGASRRVVLEAIRPFFVSARNPLRDFRDFGGSKLRLFALGLEQGAGAEKTANGNR